MRPWATRWCKGWYKLVQYGLDECNVLKSTATTAPCCIFKSQKKRTLALLCALPTSGLIDTGSTTTLGFYLMYYWLYSVSCGTITIGDHDYYLIVCVSLTALVTQWPCWFYTSKLFCSILIVSVAPDELFSSAYAWNRIRYITAYRRTVYMQRTQAAVLFSKLNNTFLVYFEHVNIIF